MNGQTRVSEELLSPDKVLESRLKEVIKQNEIPGFSVNFWKNQPTWQQDIYYRSPKELSRVNTRMHVLRTKSFGFIRAWFYKYIRNNYEHCLGYIYFSDSVCFIYYKHENYRLLIERFISEIKKHLKCEVELRYEPNDSRPGIGDSYTP